MVIVPMVMKRKVTEALNFFQAQFSGAYQGNEFPLLQHIQPRVSYCDNSAIRISNH